MRRFVYGLLICGLIGRHGVFTETLAEDKSAQPNRVMGQRVIAEGVGTTPDEAIKDAFRNAVRQVVGAVVDAETLVKNDEIIDDKVLTYSDGFIKGYEEVVGSKKVKGGLHRIKIEAQVERRSVIAKLRAANVIVKEVDGKGLFAEAVTQLEAEMDAAALLKKQFEGFPQSCITATLLGTPELVEKSTNQATVRLHVQIEPDLKAYKAFSGKLISILDKLAQSKGEFTAKYGKGPGVNSGHLSAINLNGYASGNDETGRWMPKLFDERGTWKKGQVSISVATNRTKTADSIDYKYYALDLSLETELRSVALRKGHCKIALLDVEGDIIATDRFELVEKSPNGSGDVYGSVISAFSEDYQLVNDRPKAKLFHLSLSPVFGDMRRQKTTLNISRSLVLSLDELKSVKDVKMEITFDE